jgi:hypothetical protein
MPAFALLLAACAAPPIQPGAAAPVTAGVLTPVESSSNLWSAAAGWELRHVPVVADLDGDGIEDALVDAFEVATSTSSTLVVYGPLRSPRTLPGDEDARIDGYALDALGDADGDGIPDLSVMHGWDDPVYLVPGPLNGLVDPVLSGTPRPPGSVADFNGDGVLDLAVQDTLHAQLDLTWGPQSRWGQAPDAIISPQCGYDVQSWSSEAPKAWPDLDGDGVPELWVAGFGTEWAWEEDPCMGLLMPLPASGTYDPVADPKSHSWTVSFELVADQTGDGQDDVFVPEMSAILAAPVAFADGGVSSAQTLAVDPTAYLPVSLRFDLTGDGIPDFLGASEQDVAGGDPHGAFYIVPGGAALSSIHLGDGWDWGTAPGQLVGGGVEDGIGVVLAGVGSDIAVVDLGAASIP